MSTPGVLREVRREFADAAPNARGRDAAHDRMASVRTPAERDAAAIVERVRGTRVLGTKRLDKGGGRFVYECRDEIGKVVVRMASGGDTLASAVGWHAVLRELGVPTPELLAHGDEPFPHMLLTRLPGTDLGEVVEHLAVEQLRAIAAEVADAQHRVWRLPPLPGYGYARSYHDETLARSCDRVLDRLVERARHRVEVTHAFDAVLVKRVAALVDAHRAELRATARTPFLDDTTTRNVIVDRGLSVGIVDYDFIASGDPLFVPALTRAALVAHDHPETYADLLLEELGLGDHGLLPLYEALFGLDILSEAGWRFGDRDPEPIDDERQERLGTFVESR